MSCDINWNSFEKGSVQSWTKELLYDALNSGKRPHILSSEIKIKDLEFGKKAPSFEILEIGDLASDRFRGIFKLKYDGNANITLITSIQASLLNIYERNTQELGGEFALPRFKLASQPFSLPLNVKLSNIKLSGIIIVVFSKSKGLTLVFKNDPLEKINVSSTFDNVPVIERFLQKQIENQIRDLFRDILPGVLHKVSQKWTTDSFINQLHTKLTRDSGIKGISIFEVNPTEPELSPANMLRLSTLTTSRQSFRLSVPIMKEFIDRQGIYKYDAEKFRLESKNIPIELISDENYSKLDNKIIEISKIQCKSYLNEKNHKSLKRRRIKMKIKPGKPKNSVDTGSITDSEATLVVNNTTAQEREHSRQTLKLQEHEHEHEHEKNEKQVQEQGEKDGEKELVYGRGQEREHEQDQKQVHKQEQEKQSSDLNIKQLKFFHNSTMPQLASSRKSQNKLLNVGLGNYQIWNDAPPPYD